MQAGTNKLVFDKIFYLKQVMHLSAQFLGYLLLRKIFFDFKILLHRTLQKE